LSESIAKQCQRVRHDGVGTVIGEEMCRAVDDVAGEVVRLAAVDIEYARPDAGSAPPMSETVGTVSRLLRYDVEARKRPISGRMRFRYSAEPASGCPWVWRRPVNTARSASVIESGVVVNPASRWRASRSVRRAHGPSPGVATTGWNHSCGILLGLEGRRNEGDQRRQARSEGAEHASSGGSPESEQIRDAQARLTRSM
jgi:hypothetical protein